MKYTVIIPARENSKRIKNKNIKILGNIPLIEHTIKFAIQTDYDIIVTSDSYNIKILCEKYPNVIFHNRKKELSEDNTPTLDVLKNVIETYSLTSNIILLQPTSPIRSRETLNSLIKLFESTGDTVFGVEKIDNPRYGKIKNSQYQPINYSAGTRSQDIDDIYRENGNIYVFNKDNILQKKFYNEKMSCIEIKENERIDIDTEIDFLVAEELIKRKNAKIETIKINNKRSIGLNEPCFIIAEACDNHMGRMDYAYKMIDIAILCGADAIKFQHHLPDEEMLKDVPMSANFKEPLYEILKKFSLSLEQHKELKKYCDSKNIIYMCTPFSKKAADEIEDLVDLFKIGSGELTDHPTLIEIAKKGKPMILSTGMSNVEEIEETLNILRKFNENIMILNCTSEYPPNYKDINVKLIPKLKEKFGIIVGHSDHTPDNYSCFAAVSCGAKIVEKHIILNKLHPGPDQNVSIDPMGLQDLVEGIRKIEQSLGENKTIHDLEKPIKDWARRSIVTIKDIKEGDTFTLDNLWTKRPGTGIPAKKLFDILGKKCKKDIGKDKLLELIFVK